MKSIDLKSQENSLLFLEFILKNGFNPNNYDNILELIQSVPNSLSKYLTRVNQFLLSKEVNYNELKEYCTKGAKGYIDGENGIVVPKSLEADQHFLNNYPKVPYKMHSYRYPNILDFDSLILYHDWSIEELNQIKSALYYRIEDYYIGFITDKNDKNLSRKIKFYNSLLHEINIISKHEHTIVQGITKEKNKELYLIRKK